eukprot:TRINITY_DN15347_c0_g1_i1.p1 TRINITY_DN15347_c0_g1~~TRINITY_DN15347_c0_g1_i1.p1  ORF type:complete len:495 (+),score=49.26 TRINITY_DN15347_c0_g1_i1:121-1605(+)
MLRRLQHYRSCFTKVDGRDVTPGYTGGAVEGWPVFPKNLSHWGDDEAAKYLFQYNSIIAKEFESPGRPHNVTRRTPLLRRINEDLHQLEQRNIQIGPQTYCTYVELMSRAGVMGPITLTIPEKLRKLGYPPCIRTYNSILQGFARAGKLSEFQRTRRQMMTDKIKPNTFTYNSAMTLFIQRKQFDYVGALYQEMLSTGIPPNSITFDKVLAAAPTFKVSHSIFTHDMPRLNINPRPTHFVSMLASCRFEGPETMTQSGQKVMMLLSECGFKADTDHHDAYARIFKELGDLKGLEQAMHERVSSGVPLTASSSATYIATCASILANERNDSQRRDLINSAEKCFSFAIQSGYQGFQPLYIEILRVYAEGKCLSKATLLIKSLKGSLGHIRESSSLMLVLHRLYLRCGSIDLADETKRQLIKRWVSLGYSQQVIEERLQLSVSHTSRVQPGSKRPDQHLFKHTFPQNEKLDSALVSNLEAIVENSIRKRTGHRSRA